MSYGSRCTRCGGWVENAYLHGEDRLCLDCHAGAIAVVGAKVIPYVSDAVSPYTDPETGDIVPLPRFVPVTVIAVERDPVTEVVRLLCQADDGRVFRSWAGNLGAAG